MIENATSGLQPEIRSENATQPEQCDLRKILASGTVDCQSQNLRIGGVLPRRLIHLPHQVAGVWLKFAFGSS